MRQTHKKRILLRLNLSGAFAQGCTNPYDCHAWGGGGVMLGQSQRAPCSLALDAPVHDLPLQHPAACTHTLVFSPDF